MRKSTHGKSSHGFPFLSYKSIGLCLVARQAAGAPLKLFSAFCACSDTEKSQWFKKAVCESSINYIMTK